LVFFRGFDCRLFCGLFPRCKVGNPRLAGSSASYARQVAAGGGNFAVFVLLFSESLGRVCFA
jgi:hypothetical protein